VRNLSPARRVADTVSDERSRGSLASASRLRRPRLHDVGRAVGRISSRVGREIPRAAECWWPIDRAPSDAAECAHASGTADDRHGVPAGVAGVRWPAPPGDPARATHRRPHIAGRTVPAMSAARAGPRCRGASGIRVSVPGRADERRVGGTSWWRREADRERFWPRSPHADTRAVVTVGCARCVPPVCPSGPGWGVPSRCRTPDQY
jgi:hypothetical protein